MTAGTTRAYWVTAPGAGELREEILAPPRDGHSLVETLFSGVSPGTERLVGRGEVPPSHDAPMACRYMAGSFALPVKYGYSLVGRGVDGALADRTLFVMHPHQERARIADGDAVVLPADLPPERAILIPNTETALNAVWDAELAPSEDVVIVGGGPVGLLIAFVLHRLGHGRAAVVDVDPARRAWIAQLPFVAATGAGDDFGPTHAVAFHTSGHGAGLQSALDLVGFEGRVVEVSWYGTRPVSVDLGGAFHYQRKRIVASQVAHVARVRRDRTSIADRRAAVLQLLADPAADLLLGPPVDFQEMPALMAELYRHNLQSACPLIRYP